MLTGLSVERYVILNTSFTTLGITALWGQQKYYIHKGIRMEYCLSLLIFIVIGIVPSALAGHFPLDWQWWATCVPLCGGIFLRDYYLPLAQVGT